MKFFFGLGLIFFTNMLWSATSTQEVEFYDSFNEMEATDTDLQDMNYYLGEEDLEYMRDDLDKEYYTDEAEEIQVSNDGRRHYRPHRRHVHRGDRPRGHGPPRGHIDHYPHPPKSIGGYWHYPPAPYLVSRVCRSGFFYCYTHYVSHIGAPCQCYNLFGGIWFYGFITAY